MKFFLFLSCLLATTTALSIRDTEQESVSKKSLVLNSCIPWSTDASAVTNLRKDGKAVTTTATPDCKIDMATGRIDDDAKRRYNPSGKTCNMGIPADKLRAGKDVYVYKNGEHLLINIDECPREASTLAFFLPQYVDMNTYMILDSERAYWLFTSELGGCDVFVGISGIAANRNKPLIIHANADEYTNADMTENARVKGKRADNIIGDHAADGYQLTARVYLQRENVDADYWSTYEQNHPSVKLYRYVIPRRVPELFYFIAYYEEKRGAWTFFLKGKNTGKITAIKLHE